MNEVVLYELARLHLRERLDRADQMKAKVRRKRRLSRAEYRKGHTCQTRQQEAY